MPKHPKPTAEPPTAPIRLTPQEIVELRESAYPPTQRPGSFNLTRSKRALNGLSEPRRFGIKRRN
jgi:hypothetical protein